jgi:hypothetical protein
LNNLSDSVPELCRGIVLEVLLASAALGALEIIAVELELAALCDKEGESALCALVLVSSVVDLDRSVLTLGIIACCYGLGFRF